MKSSYFGSCYWTCSCFLFKKIRVWLYKDAKKAMATHSSTLAWRIPWVEELGGLQSRGSWRVGHDWATSLSLFTFMHWRRKWQPTPVFLPGESQGWRSLCGLPSMGLHRVGHNWATSLSLLTFMHWRRKWQPTPVFLPGESQGRGAWWAAVYGITQSRTRLKRLSSSSSMLFKYQYLCHKAQEIVRSDFRLKKI